MKKISKFLAILFLVLVFLGCKDTDSGSSPKNGYFDFDKDTSYAFGMNEGMYMTDYFDGAMISVDINQFIKGMTDYLTEGKTRFTIDEANEILDKTFTALMMERAAGEAQREIDFLIENSRRPGVTVTSSGLQYEVLVEADGPKPGYYDHVLAHYTGRLIDGMVFDTSYDYYEPVEFALDGLLPAMTEGLQLMSAGSVYRIFIPSEQAYGPEGLQGYIPPYSTLVFDIELLEILGEDHSH